MSGTRATAKAKRINGTAVVTPESVTSTRSPAPAVRGMHRPEPAATTAPTMAGSTRTNDSAAKLSIAGIGTRRLSSP